MIAHGRPARCRAFLALASTLPKGARAQQFVHATQQKPAGSSELCQKRFHALCPIVFSKSLHSMHVPLHLSQPSFDVHVPPALSDVIQKQPEEEARLLGARDPENGAHVTGRGVVPREGKPVTHVEGLPRPAGATGAGWQECVGSRVCWHGRGDSGMAGPDASREHREQGRHSRGVAELSDMVA